MKAIFKNKESIVVSDNWTAYATYLDDELAFITLDLDAPEQINDANNTYIISISSESLQMDSFFEDDSIFEQIDLDLKEYLSDKGLSSYLVGTIKYETAYYLVFVSNNTLLKENHIKEALHNFTDTFTFDFLEDDDWALYVNVLYPSLHEASKTHNFLLCESLLAAGDDLQSEREIYYYLVFNHLDDLETFLELINSEYNLVKQKQLDNTNYAITIKNIACPTLDNMNDITNYLNDLLVSVDGYLDCWQTNLEN